MNAPASRLPVWIPLRPLLACGVWAIVPAAFADEPTARMLPVRAVDPPVVRAAPPAAPAPQFQGPLSVPAPGVKPQAGPTPPAPNSPPPRSLFAPPTSGQKPVFGTAPPAPPTEAKGWGPNPDPRQTTAPPLAPSGVYAGPPAYRWYGYGGVQPGGNPYSPNGRYPQGSDSWYTQSGATPGAFPVPVGGVPVVPVADPPVLATTVPTRWTPPEPTVRPPVVRPPLDLPEPPTGRSVLAEATPVKPAPVVEPTMPSGGGTPV